MRSIGPLGKKGRKIVVDGREFWYVVGEAALVVWTPTGQKAIHGLDRVTGQALADLDRGRWKRTRDGMVTPGQVRAFLRRQYSRKGEP